MSTTPAPPPARIAVSISDPLSADVQAVSAAVTAFFTFLSTPEGQNILAGARTDVASFEAMAGKAWGAIKSLFGHI